MVLLERAQSGSAGKKPIAALAHAAPNRIPIHGLPEISVAARAQLSAVRGAAKAGLSPGQVKGSPQNPAQAREIIPQGECARNLPALRLFLEQRKVLNPEPTRSPQPNLNTCAIEKTEIGIARLPREGNRCERGVRTDSLFFEAGASGGVPFTHWRQAPASGNTPNGSRSRG